MIITSWGEVRETPPTLTVEQRLELIEMKLDLVIEALDRQFFGVLPDDDDDVVGSGI